MAKVISRPATVSFLCVFIVGTFPQAMLNKLTPLISERLIPGAGWIELFFLSLYASWLTGLALDDSRRSKVRTWAWLLFSIVFFIQFAIGLLGVKKFLMTGALHVPVPAMILAGPIYRASASLFMPVLFLSTVVLAGGAWCSWFCYFGSWDNLSARKQERAGGLPKNWFLKRILLFGAVILGAIALRIAGVPGSSAAVAGILFGIVGVGVMAFISRKTGTMIHCTVFCPIGLLTNLVSKINPFRIRIGEGCTECRSCSRVCRYGALSSRAITQRKPGLTCTLCGDCLSACRTSQISYHFPGLGAEAAKKVFVVIVVVIHTLFLGFGRM
jgi:polyferredoxin